MKSKAQDYNVLFIISDQHKKAVTGCYGDEVVQTPNIDRLAEGGVRFENAYCQCPLCGPSRSAIMTGSHCHTCRGLTHTQLEAIRVVPTLGTVFREAGYVTGAIGKVHIRGEDEVRDLGFDDRQMRYYTYGYRDYVDAIGAENVDKYNAYRKGATAPRRDVYNCTNEPIRMNEAMMYDALVVDRCVEFLEKHKDEKFFLWAGLEKPHPEWYAPAEYHAMYDPAKMTLPETLYEKPERIPKIPLERLRTIDNCTERQVRGALAAYYADVSYLDAKVGQLLAALERLGLAENTIIVYTTDHGEHLFEHGMVQKHCFYEAAVAVPLMITCPGIIPAGETREHIVSLVDLFPTWLDLTGIEHPGTLEGESLVSVIEGAAPTEGRTTFSEFYKWGMSERMIRTTEWKYVHTDGDVAQLYDVKKDPLERENLAGEKRYADVVKRLDARVHDGWEKPDPRMIQPNPMPY